MLIFSSIMTDDRTQRKTIKAVAMDKCKSRINRCKLISSCKDNYGRLLATPSNSDYLCGTDSKTYTTECDLAQATCL